MRFVFKSPDGDDIELQIAVFFIDHLKLPIHKHFAFPGQANNENIF